MAEDLFCWYVTCFGSSQMNDFNFFDYLLVMCLRLRLTRAECESYFFFLAQNLINRTLENANILLLSKKATDKDRSLKTQLLVTSNDGQKKLSSENVWKNKGFFFKTWGLTWTIPENTLFYINQSFLSALWHKCLRM